MFQLFLNGQELVVSGEGREAVAAVFDLLWCSEGWQREHCTLEARFSPDCEEVADLLEDTVHDKATTMLTYPPSCANRIRLIQRELVDNALEHGTDRVTEKTIRVIVNFSFAYISVEVHNPSDVPVDRSRWTEEARQRLEKNQRRGRGRGLRRIEEDLADKVSDTSRYIRATVYRDEVKTVVEDYPWWTLIVLMSGQTNRTWPEHVKKKLENTKHDSVVVCLNRAEYYRFKATVDPPVDNEIDFEGGTRNLEAGIQMIDSAMPEKGVRIVTQAGVFQSTMPPDTFYTSIDDALRSLWDQGQYGVRNDGS